MSYHYDRKHLNESLLTLVGQIHPSFCIGRRKESLNDKTEEIFSQSFFANASQSELQLLWEFAEKEGKHGELLLNFAIKEDDSKSSRPLEKGEMKIFHFSDYVWEVLPIAETEDELRQISQAQCLIVFTAR